MRALAKEDPAMLVWWARRTAWRLLRVHSLRAADALQLAAAIVAAEGHPASLEIVALDDRLTAAARREASSFAATPDRGPDRGRPAPLRGMPL